MTEINTATGEVVISYLVPADTVDILGIDRVAILDHVIFGALSNSIQMSFLVAQSGALRWHPNVRPEVLINACGDLL